MGIQKTYQPISVKWICFETVPQLEPPQLPPRQGALVWDGMNYYVFGRREIPPGQLGGA